MIDRKEFIKTASAALLSFSGACTVNGDLKKTTKSIRFEMIHTKDSIQNKLLLAKEAGFDAFEVNSLGYERTEMLKALKETGIKVSSVYHSENWTRSLSSPVEKERKEAVSSVLESAKTAEVYKADFVQLLPGTEVEYSEESQKSLLKSLQELSAAVKGKARFLLQNFPGRKLSDPQFFEFLLSKLDPKRFGLALDTEIAAKNGGVSQWKSLLKQYFSKVDADEVNFKIIRSLFDASNRIECVSLDVSGGDKARVLHIGTLSRAFTE